MTDGFHSTSIRGGIEGVRVEIVMEASSKICKSCDLFLLRYEIFRREEEMLEKNFVIQKIPELSLFRFAKENRLFHRSS